MRKENENTTPNFSISLAAKQLNISVHTLRMYEREGLIIPFKKKSNQRLYSQADINRIQCIRDGISKSKISINGIKTIYSLIPCWQIVKCSLEDRNKCDGYKKHGLPCWSYKHPKTVCETKNCRECEVYQSFENCESVKNKIREVINK